MGTGFAAEKFRSVRCGALQNLHGREAGFFHQVKFTEERGPVNGPDVPGIGSRGDSHPCVFQLLQIGQRDIIRLLNPIDDIANASDIDTVMKNGVAYPADSILK